MFKALSVPLTISASIEVLKCLNLCDNSSITIPQPYYGPPTRECMNSNLETKFIFARNVVYHPITTSITLIRVFTVISLSNISLPCRKKGAQCMQLIHKNVVSRKINNIFETRYFWNDYNFISSDTFVIQNEWIWILYWSPESALQKAILRLARIILSAQRDWNGFKPISRR